MSAVVADTPSIAEPAELDAEEAKYDVNVRTILKTLPELVEDLWIIVSKYASFPVFREDMCYNSVDKLPSDKKRVITVFGLHRHKGEQRSSAFVFDTAYGREAMCLDLRTGPSGANPEVIAEWNRPKHYHLEQMTVNPWDWIMERQQQKNRPKYGFVQQESVIVVFHTVTETLVTDCPHQDLTESNNNDIIGAHK